MKALAPWLLFAGTVILTAAAVAFIPLGTPAKISESFSADDVRNPLAPAYVGDAKCAECHAQEAEWHKGSGHAHTLRSANLCQDFEAILGRDFPDPERGGTFRFECASGGLEVAYTKEGQTRREPIQFALGSGHRATTFVTLVDQPDGTPTAIEHRLSVFGAEQRVALTPSHAGQPVQSPQEVLGRLKTGADVTNCINCHSVTSQVTGARIENLRANVGCESCHGPGRDHVVAMLDKQSDTHLRFSPSQATAEQEVRLCGRCHRFPDLVNTIPDPDDTKLARFQPVGLSQSACFRRSNGELRCTTCHNPHRSVEIGSEGYNRRCATCHSGAETSHKTCPVESDNDCVKCHMPSVEVHPGLFFHDHWIRVRAEPTAGEKTP